MRIARNSLAERAPGEVVYYAGHEVDPYAFNVRRMDSHGGWIATPSDLVQAVCTRDINRAHSLARRLRAGTIWINCYGILDPISPFGGYKQSGFGRELGKHSIELYTQAKSVFIKF